MGWLVGSILASLVAAVIVVKVFDYLFAGMAGGLANTARAVLFVVTWTAVTAQAGMHGFTSRIRALRKSIAPEMGDIR
jgi:hypothetical protein